MASDFFASGNTNTVDMGYIDYSTLVLDCDYKTGAGGMNLQDPALYWNQEFVSGTSLPCVHGQNFGHKMCECDFVCI